MTLYHLIQLTFSVVIFPQKYFAEWEYKFLVWYRREPHEILDAMASRMTCFIGLVAQAFA